VILAPSLVFLGGADTWQAFYAKISAHAEIAGGNQLGLKTLLIGAPILERIAQLAIACLYLSSLPRLTSSQSVILGGLLVFTFSSISSYYYSFLVLFFLWDAERAQTLASTIRSSLLLAIPLVAGVFILLSPNEHELALYDHRVYVAASVALVIFFAALSFEVFRPSSVAST
jgi:hypothetical protein